MEERRKNPATDSLSPASGATESGRYLFYKTASPSSRILLGDLRRLAAVAEVELSAAKRKK